MTYPITEPKTKPRDDARQLYRRIFAATGGHGITESDNPEWDWSEHERTDLWQICEVAAERLHEAKNRHWYNINITTKHGDATRYADAIADVLCWMEGYRAAMGGQSTDIINMSALRELKALLETTVSDGASLEVSF